MIGFKVSAAHFRNGSDSRRCDIKRREKLVFFLLSAVTSFVFNEFSCCHSSFTPFRHVAVQHETADLLISCVRFHKVAITPSGSLAPGHFHLTFDGADAAIDQRVSGR